MNPSIEVCENWGTFRQGTLRMPYPKLVEILGDPHEGPSMDDKVDVEWCFVGKENPKIHFGVWNYKNGPAYCGDSVKLEDVAVFSIGVNPERIGDKNFDVPASIEFLKELFGDKVSFP